MEILRSWGNINLDNNLFTTLPEFTPSAEYGPTFSLANNFFDFSTLERFTHIGYVVYGPQQNINDVSAIALKVGSPLVIPARDPGPYSTIIWEKQQGDSWGNINSLNEEGTQHTYTRNSATLDDQGNYR